MIVIDSQEFIQFKSGYQSDSNCNMKCKKKIQKDNQENEVFFHQGNNKMWLKRFLQRDTTVMTVHRKT